ncbi:efflux RND transporter periplasmic adaptor subunit [Haloferula sargassicola]|uniref:RND efflux pump membrane fusion protein barrel-sandwich domain-containing protein n=1 Tax=Haloferula sargassicola TaxID=490096 RepID=A0ABP9UKM8_9BACT
MKNIIYFLLAVSALGQDSNTVILDETAVKNLRLETVVAEERDFERTVFAVGRVEEIPGNRYSVSSRISGRAIEVNAFMGEQVTEGQVLVRVESRQPGNPPPTIELRAPHDGLITASHVLKGQPVEPDKDLLDISDRSELWVVAQIPEQMAAGIGKGTSARIHFPALGGEPVTAELLRFGVQANRDAGSVEGVFQVPNEDGRLLPGMRAEFEIVVDTRPGVLAIPETAVQGDPASRVVFVRDFDLPNAFDRVPVVLGEKGGGWVEVQEGLFPGDEVVTRGSYSLGFVGGASGMSLKEALDAAHGHEHNEDGSEMTAEQKAEHDHEDGDHDDHAEASSAPGWVLWFAISASIAALVFAQLWWNSQRKEA